jgi:hypothetical protein
VFEGVVVGGLAAAPAREEAGGKERRNGDGNGVQHVRFSSGRKAEPENQSSLIIAQMFCNFEKEGKGMPRPVCMQRDNAREVKTLRKHQPRRCSTCSELRDN